MLPPDPVQVFQDSGQIPAQTVLENPPAPRANPEAGADPHLPQTGQATALAAACWMAADLAPAGWCGAPGPLIVPLSTV